MLVVIVVKVVNIRDWIMNEKNGHIDITVVIPTYNERDNINILINKIDISLINYSYNACNQRFHAGKANPRVRDAGDCPCCFGNLFAEKKGRVINVFALPIFLFFRKNIKVCRERREHAAQHKS